MWYWTPIAMVRILGFFLFGILLFELTGSLFSIEWIWIFTGLLAVSYIFFQIRSLKKWSGVPGLTFITFSGWLLTAQFDESASKNHLGRNPVHFDAYVGILLDQPEKTRSGYRHRIQVTRVYTDNSWINFHTKAFCYLNQAPDAHTGDVLLIKGHLTVIPTKAINNSFNYGLYLKRQNIFFHHFVRSNSVVVIKNPNTSLVEFAIRIREWCTLQIKMFVPGANEQSIASALLIGQSDDLDPELNQHYAVTGTLHVLSVSGMHTGLLYWIILFLCKPLQQVKNGEWMILGIVMTVLWLYAMITGFSPSVLRAVVMLSFITVSKPFGLRSNIWNSLAASAFLLLMADPWLITRISFQLSYLAVIGIVWLHPALVRQWEPEPYLISAAWNLISISISAQLTTLPISILNFHQFPVWFIPANLIIIPLSSVALFSGLAFLLLSFIPSIAPIAGYILSKEIEWMNLITTHIGQWPLGPFADIQIDPAHALCMMVILIGLDQYIRQRDRFWLGLLVAGAGGFGLIDMIYR